MQNYTQKQLDLLTNIEKLRVKRSMLREQLALLSREIRSMKSVLSHSVKTNQ